MKTQELGLGLPRIASLMRFLACAALAAFPEVVTASSSVKHAEASSSALHRLAVETHVAELGSFRSTRPSPRCSGKQFQHHFVGFAFEQNGLPAPAQQVGQIPNVLRPTQAQPQQESGKPEVATQEVTAVDIKTKLAEVEVAAGLSDEEKKSAKELLQQAQQSLKSAEKHKADQLNFQQLTESVGQELQKAERLMAQKIPASPPMPFGSLANAKAELDEKVLELTRAREKLTTTVGEGPRRQARLLEIPSLIAKADERLKQTETQLTQLASPEDSMLMDDAKRLQLLCLKAQLRNEIGMLEAERRYYVEATELLPLELEILQQAIPRLEKQTEQIKAIVESKRETEIDRLLNEATDRLNETSGPLRDAVAQNVKLVQQYATVSKRLIEVTADIEKTRRALEEIRVEAKTARERIEAVGLNETLGLMLRRSKANLAERKRAFQTEGSLQKEIRDLQIDMFSLQDWTRDSTENQLSLDKLMELHRVPVTDWQPMREQAVEVLSQRRRILAPMTQATTELFNQLVSLDTDRRKVVNEINQHIGYINEHVLWIRSGAILGRGDIDSFRDAVSWLVAAENWRTIPTILWLRMETNAGLFLSLAFINLALLSWSRRMRMSIEAEGKIAAAGGCYRFTPTAIVLLNTLAIALVWPCVLFSMGWLLAESNDQSFAQAVSKSLISVAVIVFPLELLRQTARKNGLGQSHLGWSEEPRKFLKTNLYWFIWSFGSLLFLLNLIEFQPMEDYRNTLGRSLMAVLLIVTLTFIVHLFRPNSLLYRDQDLQEQDDYWFRLRTLRFMLGSMILCGLLLFTLAGYHYTTYQLGSRLLQTSALLIGTLLLFGLSMRWLMVRRRKLKMDQLIAHREELVRRQAADPSATETLKVSTTNEPGLDANEVSKQARELLIAMISFLALLIAWNIWADLLPAVGILDRVQVWSVTVDGVPDQVSLKNVFQSLLAVTFTVLAVKNLPGLLELLLLQRLPLDSGARYAVATIFRYILSLLGMIVAFSFLKVQWSQFGWMAAAISVGIGFGLQEIVANFISGLILLIERPVRVGDVVTIEGTTGIVSRIQMRATTVTNWDQQELVVPNKSLITNSIVNWTLTNTLTRVTLQFGVAYGSDPILVRNLILTTVTSNPEILADPKPSVTFEGFGDSSLNFTVRCCISGLEKRLETIHQLNVSINATLRAHQIEIPFPQRVLHMASTEKENEFGSQDRPLG